MFEILLAVSIVVNIVLGYIVYKLSARLYKGQFKNLADARDELGDSVGKDLK